MHYTDKQAVRELQKSALIIAGLGMVILLLSQLQNSSSPVRQVLGAWTSIDAK